MMLLPAGDIVALVVDREGSELHGYWDERNNTLGAVPKERRAGIAARAIARLLRNQKNKREIVYTWPTWVYQAAALEC